MRIEHLELLDDCVLERLEAELRSTLRRRSPREPTLAGALRALAPYSPRLRDAMVGALELLVRRGSYRRPLYAAAVGSLADAPERRGISALRRALLEVDDPGTFASLAAACLLSDPELSEPLVALSRSRHAHVAFAAEVARVARGESSGRQVVGLAPKIKESRRIALCSELFVPLVYSRPLASEIAPALGALREAERHLGRWLALGEVAVRAGDRAPRSEAADHAQRGPAPSRAAWGLVAWALDPGAAAPAVRPTLELVTRLSDRPSADRDPSFLFRMARARVPAARTLLENLARVKHPADEGAVRSAMHLARDYAAPAFTEWLTRAATRARRGTLAGLSVAALYDAGERGVALGATDQLIARGKTSCLAWGALVRVAARTGQSAEVVTEARFRRVQRGWVG